MFHGHVLYGESDNDNRVCVALKTTGISSYFRILSFSSNIKENGSKGDNAHWGEEPWRVSA